MLVFTKTAGFRHASIPAAIQAVRDLGTKNGFDVYATEDDGAFSAAGLAPYAAVVFLLTTGDVLDAAEQAAVETYLRAGHGFVGVHSAADTERDWPWYGRLVGAWSSGHPEIQTARRPVVSPTRRSTAGAARALEPRRDEWYGFLSNPRADGVRVLLTLDECTYLPRDWSMGADHPVAWEHAFDGGRAWYTELGHTRSRTPSRSSSATCSAGSGTRSRATRSATPRRRRRSIGLAVLGARAPGRRSRSALEGCAACSASARRALEDAS